MHTKRNVIIILFLIIVLLLLSVTFIIYMNYTSEEGAYACVYRDNELIKTINLADVEEPYTVTVEGEEGAYNVLEVRSGAIAVADASCPDGLCMNIGFVSNSLIPITCLPNHLVIRVFNENDDAENGLDVIAY